jgi:hypothetical protein
MKVHKDLAEVVLSKINEDSHKLDYFGNEMDLKFSISSSTNSTIHVSANGTTVQMDIRDLINSEGNFDSRKWNNKLSEKKEELQNKLIAQAVADKIK